MLLDSQSSACTIPTAFLIMYFELITIKQDEEKQELSEKANVAPVE